VVTDLAVRVDHGIVNARRRLDRVDAEAEEVTRAGVDPRMRRHRVPELLMEGGALERAQVALGVPRCLHAVRLVCLVERVEVARVGHDVRVGAAHDLAGAEVHVDVHPHLAREGLPQRVDLLDAALMPHGLELLRPNPAVCIERASVAEGDPVHHPVAVERVIQERTGLLGQRAGARPHVHILTREVLR
jgi:hypothetical protein